MKLRLQTNSIRLRLKRGEVAQLVKDRFVEEVITFSSDQTLRYRVQISMIVKAPQAIFSAGEIDVALPDVIARQWALGDDVAIEACQPAGENPDRKGFCLSQWHGRTKRRHLPKSTRWNSLLSWIA